ncbi:MAG: PBS lyase [Desulfovibrio sp.]
MTQRYVVVLPEPMERAGCRGPSLVERLQGLCGREHLFFPALGVSPARLAGVLLESRGQPGRVTVNGRPTNVLWRRGRRMLLAPGPFCRYENQVSVSRGAGDVALYPVVDATGDIAALGLAPGRAWRLQTLEGQDAGPAPASAPVGVCGGEVLPGLVRGLAGMVAGNGDVWSFYDLAEKTFRLAGWRWDTGLVLEALAAAARHRIVKGVDSVARVVADRLMASRLTHPDCLGGFPEWTDLRYGTSPHGVGRWVVPFNAAFIAAGLQRLGEHCDAPAYSLAARESLRLAAAKGVTAAGGVAGYYFERSRRWQYVGQINDSGVLGRGLALFPGEAWAVEAADRACGYILDKAVRPDGHIGRAWWDPVGAFPPGPPLFPEWKRHPGRVVAKVFLRGQAWVLMGLTGALRLGAAGRIGPAARRLVDFIVDAQCDDGSWLYSRNQPALGSCAKTTAALALALAEWSHTTGEAWPLAAARRAIGFLDASRQPRDVPSELAGMPVDTSAEGCIIYFRDRPVVCAYTAALELLARLALEEAP